jgi:hypothetical protein
VCHALLFAPEERYAHNSLQLDITGLPGWSLLEDDQRLRVAELARHHLQQAEVDPETDVTPNRVTWRLLAGIRALVLLCKTWNQPPSLSPDRWAIWATALVGVPADFNEEKLLLVPLQFAYRHAPRAVQDAIMALARQPDSHSELRLRRLQPVLDEAATRWLTELATAADVDRATAAEALRQLLSRDAVATLPLLHTKLDPLPPSGTPARERAEDVAATALATTPAAAWSTVWPALQADPAVGDAVLLRLANDDHSIPAALDEQQLVELWRFLDHRFPRSEDSVVQGAHFVSPRESVADFRDRLLPELAQRGTDQAVDLLRQLAETTPDRPDLARLATDAERAARRSDWTPLPARHIVALLSAPDRVVLRTSHDLLQAVLDVLDRIQRTLRSATPMATLMWNHGRCHTQGGTTGSGCRPKTEDEISDFLKWRIDELLGHSIVNREVQVERRRPTGVGTRIDVLVQARAKTPPHDLLQVVIEVKGCWNDEVPDTLETQLMRRYLDRLPGSAGIYLVAWFDPAHWDSPGRWTTDPVRGQRAALLREIEDRASRASSSSSRSVAAYALDCSMPARSVVPFGAGFDSLLMP